MKKNEIEKAQKRIQKYEKELEPNEIQEKLKEQLEMFLDRKRSAEECLNSPMPSHIPLENRPGVIRMWEHGLELANEGIQKVKNGEREKELIESINKAIEAKKELDKTNYR